MKLEINQVLYTYKRGIRKYQVIEVLRKYAKVRDEISGAEYLVNRVDEENRPGVFYSRTSHYETKSYYTLDALQRRLQLKEVARILRDETPNTSWDFEDNAHDMLIRKLIKVLTVLTNDNYLGDIWQNQLSTEKSQVSKVSSESSQRMHETVDKVTTS